MKKIIAGSLALLPFVGLAASTEPGANVEKIIESVSSIVNMLIPIAVGLALAVFFFGLVRFIWKRDAEDKSIMIWGVVAIAIMVLIWGIVGFLADAFGIDSSAGAPDISDITIGGIEQ